MTLRRAVAVLALLALTATAADAAAFRAVWLTLPRAATAGEDVVLRVRAGVLPRGAEVDVYDDHGTLLGTVSPFGAHGEAGTYTIPLRTAPSRHIAVRLVLTEAGRPSRAPSLSEVRGVTPAFMRVTR